MNLLKALVEHNNLMIEIDKALFESEQKRKEMNQEFTKEVGNNDD